MLLFSKVKDIFKRSNPSQILERDHNHFYLNTGISHDYPNKWATVHACLDAASNGDFSMLRFVKGSEIMSYSEYLKKLSTDNEWKPEDLGGCELTCTGIEAIVKVLDTLAEQATKLSKNISEKDLFKLYNIYRKAYFIIFEKELEMELPKNPRPNIFEKLKLPNLKSIS